MWMTNVNFSGNIHSRKSSKKKSIEFSLAARSDWITKIDFDFHQKHSCSHTLCLYFSLIKVSSFVFPPKFTWGFFLFTHNSHTWLCYKASRSPFFLLLIIFQGGKSSNPSRDTFSIHYHRAPTERNQLKSTRSSHSYISHGLWMEKKKEMKEGFSALFPLFLLLLLFPFFSSFFLLSESPSLSHTQHSIFFSRIYFMV